jgi:hypothetical protein
MKPGTARIAAFSAAALSVGTLAGNAHVARAICEGFPLVQTYVHRTQLYSVSKGDSYTDGSPTRGAGHLQMNTSNGGLLNIPVDSMYGVTNDEPYNEFKLIYYPGGGELRVRGCRAGLTSESFTCTSYVSQTTTPGSSTSATSIFVQLDAIAGASGSVLDHVFAHGWSPGATKGITMYEREKGVRGIDAKLGIDPDWNNAIGAGIDACVPTCW